MRCSLFQRCQIKQINHNFNFRGYKGPRKLKTANIGPHVLGPYSRKFGDAKIFHFTVIDSSFSQKIARGTLLEIV